MQIKKLFFLLLIPTLNYAWFFNFSNPPKPFVIMIEAAGDTAQPGRSIGDNFESTITYEIALALKKILIEQCPHTKVVINRSIHEAVAPLQNANFANKLNVDLYLSIHAFAETETKPRIYLYQFSYKDNFISKDADQGLSFYPYDKIYVLNAPVTNAWIQQMKQVFDRDQRWATQGVFPLPFKPLIGIKAPAIGLEIGLKDKSEWPQILEVMAQALITVINNR